MNGTLISHIVFLLTIMPMGIIINIKLYQNVKLQKHRENGKIIQRILKTYSIVQCIIPLLTQTLVIPFLDVGMLQKLSPVVASFLLQLLRPLLTLYVYYTGLNSLVIACSRCTFIVYDRKADQIGTRKLKFFFIGMSVILPLLLVFVNECVFSIKNSPLMLITTSQACENYSSTKNDSVTECIDEILYGIENPLYKLVQENFNSTLVSIIRVIATIISVTTLSNILELFIYVHIFRFCIR